MIVNCARCDTSDVCDAKYLAIGTGSTQNSRLTFPKCSHYCVMKVLFVHQNFPGQYLHLARHLGATPGNEVVFITQRKDADLPGVRKIVYAPQQVGRTRQRQYAVCSTQTMSPRLIAVTSFPAQCPSVIAPYLLPVHSRHMPLFWVFSYSHLYQKIPACSLSNMVIFV
jgi:hypothetical protein